MTAPRRKHRNSADAEKRSWCALMNAVPITRRSDHVLSASAAICCVPGPQTRCPRHHHPHSLGLAIQRVHASQACQSVLARMAGQFGREFSRRSKRRWPRRNRAVLGRGARLYVLDARGPHKVDSVRPGSDAIRASRRGTQRRSQSA
jgi:hypothetical protein